MVNTTFSVTPRTETGKAVKRLRKNRLVPGQIMGQLDQPISVMFPEAAFVRLYETVGDTGLVYVEVEGESNPRPVLIEEVQSQPLTGQVLHVLLKQVNLKEKIKAEVPVELINDEKEIPGTVVLLVQDVIEVEALPQDLPEKFIVDASLLTEAGQVVTFAQLDYDRSKIEILISEEEIGNPIVMRQAVKEEVEEVVEVAPVEGEAAPAATETATPEKA